MNQVLQVMDDQMLKWVAELDELHKRKIEVEMAIGQLEQYIERAREMALILKQTKN